jgi:competence protein ComEC
MIRVALWVASLPGAVGRITAFSVGPLLLGTAGLILICLFRTPLRWTGAIVVVLSAAWAVCTPQPEVIVGATADSVAVRIDGRLSIMKTGADRFVIREWLAADGDARAADDASLNTGVRCDDVGCIVTADGGRIVALAREAEAMAEDCTRAALVITQRTAPPHCAATIIDRSVWRRSGALALYRREAGWHITPTQPAGYDRPWAHPPRETATSAGAPLRGAPAAPDATPAPADLEADD